MQTTGQKQTRVRAGYADCDTYGAQSPNYAACATGALDAPDHMPQGSVRVHNTGRPYPTPSSAHRDWQTPEAMPQGAMHDGPETAATVRHWGNS